MIVKQPRPDLAALNRPELAWPSAAAALGLRSVQRVKESLATIKNNREFFFLSLHLAASQGSVSIPLFYLLCVFTLSPFLSHAFLHLSHPLSHSLYPPTPPLSLPLSLSNTFLINNNKILLEWRAHALSWGKAQVKY